MARLMRAFDWSQTPLGPVETWSPALRMMVRILLVNRFPMLLWWGPHYVQLYNDAYQPIPGTKHPKSMGQRASECWPEIWHIIGPLVDTPFQGGPATWMEDIFLEIRRHGFVEETHFTIAYSPVPDETVESGIGGVLATVHEITEKVVGERRAVALRDLGARAIEAESAAEACVIAARTLEAHDKDIPFALLYLLAQDGKTAHLAAAAGVGRGEPIRPDVVDLAEQNATGWPFAEAKTSPTMVVVDRLRKRFGAVPPGPWSDPPDVAIVLPIPSNTPHQPVGFLVAGVSARLKLDEFYRGFLELVTAQVSTAIAKARAYEEGKRRAEALAELDRAKTLFFSNVSHEFRTPLTLLLGPTEDLLASRDLLPPAAQEPLVVVHRNALRLQKLVNALLDFSRIEAGRIQACYEPTDLAGRTADLASAFRAAIERAGLALVVDCPPLPCPVYVDGEMWEKIVLNLMSNAFKFTFEGEIEVKLRSAGEAVELSIRDTGTGIPEHELSHIFERFHRVDEARGRTHEGSGIGLALVQELVKLHGGSVSVESVEGSGSTFRVSIPAGTVHLPADRIGSERTFDPTSLKAPVFVEEALRWLPDEEPRLPEGVVAGGEPPAGRSREKEGRILLADDNADMRDYLRRLLCERYDVEAVADGEAALSSARMHLPDLVISDVMMPRMDGFSLLHALRADERARTVPVILLSARAGEESRTEGMSLGADDYLVKPFGARELIARVGAAIALAKARKESFLREEQMLRESNRRKDEFLAIMAHELRNPLAPIRTGLELIRLAGSDRQSVEQTRAMMERQVAHMVRLIDDLLDVSRISSGKIQVHREPVDLAQIVNAAVETQRSFVDASGLELSVALPATPVRLNGDPTRLTQVLSNLLHNAAKFTGRGGSISISGELVAPRSEGQREVRLSVKDTGVGIPREMLGSVFDLFVQVGGEHPGRGGLGIGLTLARRLVELHDGRIEARSDGAGAGKGSEFILYLPTQPGHDVRQPGGQSESQPKGMVKRRVLVVDDNRDAAESLAAMVAILGGEVRTAFDGPSGVELAASFRPEVILLDIGLPGIDGYEACRRIRKLPEGKEIFLIALTGWGKEEDKRRADDAGFNLHLMKPADPIQLERVLMAPMS
jgi:signal transduction histidine kinase